MKKNKAEKTIKGNPNKITNNQHIIPRKQLLEWSSNNKTILTSSPRIKAGSPIELSPDETIFCVQRLWNDLTEHKALKPIEDQYQKEVSHLKEGGKIQKKDNITFYYSMLIARIMIAKRPRLNNTPILTNPSMQLSKEQLEKEEIKYRDSNGPHVMTIYPPLDPSSQDQERAITSFFMLGFYQRLVISLQSNNLDNWVPIYIADQSFVISDALFELYNEQLYILPITPNIILITESTQKKLSSSQPLSIEEINDLLIKRHDRFYVKK